MNYKICCFNSFYQINIIDCRRLAKYEQILKADALIYIYRGRSDYCTLRLGYSSFKIKISGFKEKWKVDRYIYALQWTVDIRGWPYYIQVTSRLTPPEFNRTLTFCPPEKSKHFQQALRRGSQKNILSCLLFNMRQPF